MEEKIILFKKLCDAYYNIKGNSAGGNLHIVLDDGNMDDHSILYCKDCCDNDPKGKELCELLLSIPFERRIWLNLPYPNWSEHSFDYDYEEFKGEEIKTGDFVRTWDTNIYSEFFIAGEITENEIKILGRESGFKKSECVKIKVSQ